MLNGSSNVTIAGRSFLERSGARVCWLVCLLVCVSSSTLTAICAHRRGNARSPEDLEISELENKCRVVKGTGDFNDLLECYQDLVELYVSLGRQVRAEQLADELRTMGTGPNAKRAEAWSLDIKGNVYFARASYSEAFDVFDRAYRIFNEAGDTYGEAIALKDKGITQKYLSDPIEAIETLNAARILFVKTGNRPGELSALLNIAFAYDLLGFRKPAVRTRKQILEIARVTGNKAEMYHALVGIADYYSDVNSTEQAMDLYQQALAIADEIDARPQYRAWLLASMASAYHALGDLNESLKIRTEVLRLSRQYGTTEQIAAAYRNLGDEYVSSEPSKSIAMYEQSLIRSNGQESPVRRFTYAGMARAYAAMGDLDLSVRYSDMALDEFESARGALISTEQRSAFLHDHQFIYDDLVRTLLRRAETNNNALKDNERAFEVNEASKAHRLFEAILAMGPAAARGIAGELGERQKQFADDLSTIQRKILDKDTDESERNLLVDELNRKELDLDIVTAKLENGMRPIGVAKTPPGNVLGRIQASLDPETALLEYSVGAHSTEVFVIEQNGFGVNKLPISSRELNTSVQNYVDLLATDDSFGWKPISDRLGRDLLVPVVRQLDPAIKKIVIVPDGNLNYLPFESLIVSAQGRLAIEDYEISYAPSGTVLAQLNARKSAAVTRGAAIFANPTLGSNLLTQPDFSISREMMRSVFEIDDWHFDPIPGSESEGLAIADIIGRSSLFKGDEASETRLKSIPLEEYQILHFATHGLVSEEIPERSSLLLAAGETGDTEDGLLQVREILRLKASPDLVVLSGCQTANGQVLRGDGLSSITQAFLYTGARAVVGSLWNVNDRQAAELMRVFYQNLAAGKPRSAALREAKLHLIGTGRGQSPRSWAPFILIGEPNGRLSSTHKDPPAGLFGWMLSIIQRLRPA